jgi:hypothetical protein
LNTPPVKQNSDPFGSVASSSVVAPAANDFFGGKDDSFANFDAATIYTSPTSNPMSTAPAGQVAIFGHANLSFIRGQNVKKCRQI